MPVTINEEVATPPATPSALESFTYTTGRGFILEVGKPMGPLKLRMRDILSLEEIKNDTELQRMVAALLCIRSENGNKPRITNRIQFEAFIDSRFANDADINTFMNEYQKFTDPAMYALIESSMAEALEAGETTDEGIAKFIKKRLLEQNEADRDKVRL